MNCVFLLESPFTETLMMEPFTDRADDNVVGLGLIGDSRVSGDERRVMIESDERIASVLENGGSYVRLNGEVSKSGFIDGEKIRANSLESEVDTNVSGISDLQGINLVVDLNRCFTKESDHYVVELDEKHSDNVELTEKEGEYEFIDLVWGKVKSHPWWPGQIVNPSASTNKASKYFKKDSFFIAYFGDQSFAWNESVNIKPFRLNFCKFANQSDDEPFIHAVNDALREAARHIELGLACLCLSEKVHLKIKSQIIVNDGIRKEFSRIDGGDRFSTVNSFKPNKVVDFMLDLAKDPFGSNRLEVLTVGSQLSAFNRYKGFHQVQLNEYLDESDNNFDNYDNPTLYSKENLNTCGMPRKHKRLFDGGFTPCKKLRCLSDLMSNGNNKSADVDYNPNKRFRKRKLIESNNSSNGSHGQSQSQTANEFLSQICLAAKNPIEEHYDLDSLVKFSSDFRNYRLEKNMDQIENKPETETIETNGFACIKDSYWPDRIIVTKSDDVRKKECSGTALILKFTDLDSVPSVKKMNEIFRRYGALKESETRVLKKSKCVKVVFLRKCDAEIAFSSSGKYSIFGPALDSYRLDYSPTPTKTVAGGKKGGKSAI